jgi:flavin-dependent dehydrogenase
MSVVVCEAKAFPREKVCGEFMGTNVRPVLRRLGLLERFDALAGPEITHVTACVDSQALTAAMPADSWGMHPRALTRGTLDDMLLERARELGANLLQPCHVATITGNTHDGFSITTSCGDIHARIVILAHGLAQKGALNGVETAPLRRRYVSFKTPVTGCTLDDGTIAIAGGERLYAGLVKTSHNRFSLAFVVNRSRIEKSGNSPDAQLAELRRENPAFDRMIGPGTPCIPWLASGPLEPGIRQLHHDGRFFVGTAAGEVHALVGEGITLAMRGGQLLADLLLQHGLDNLPAAAHAYEQAWRPMFRRRYAPAQLFANLIMRPSLATMAGTVLDAYPELLGACIRRSGK